MKKYTTFHDFYPYYLTEHQNRISRTLHFIGTGIVIALFVVFLLTFNWQYFALMPVAGYGLSLIHICIYCQSKHLCVEKNSLV